MSPRYNKSAIMKYAHRLMKTVRDADWSWALKSAWNNARYIIRWTLQFGSEYECCFPVVVGDGVVHKNPEDPIWAEMRKYGCD